MNQAYKRAEEKIAVALREGATELDLSGEWDADDSEKLTELPESLAQLTQLEVLWVGNNHLSTLPECLGKLSQLGILDLSHNQINKLPECLGRLTQLIILDFDDNQIVTLPESLGQLSRLKALYIGNNQLNTLPESIGQLAELDFLNLSETPLNPELAAAYEQGTDSVLSYLREKAKQKIILDEAKLVLVGEGDVGKSSLLGALRGDPWVENRKTTHGVEVDIKSLQLTDAGSSKTITFNAWDFGGQNIYRHTHQLYFTAPAVYLAVWEPRRGPEQCAVAEWVKMIKQRAYDETRPDDRPRILVVATHAGAKERLAHIDEQTLRDEFDDLICGFFHVDSKTGLGLEELKAAIARESAAIPSVGRSVPKSWKEVLDALRERSKQEAYISYSQFVALCDSHGVDAELAATYAAILNELGHIIHYSTNSDLRDTVILRAEWLSKAMSYVLDDERTVENNGLVEHHDLCEIWDDPARGEDCYPAEIHSVFLKLMEYFDFSYRVARLEKGAQPASLIAQLVPYQRPDHWQQSWPPEADDGDSERSQICRIMDAEKGRSTEVAGLIYRLIVRLHRYSLGRQDYFKSIHWNSGLVLDDGFNGRAFIEEIGGDIHITVRAAYPERFLHLLCDEVRWLVENFWKGLDCKLFVPCNTPCKGLIELDEMFDNRKEGIEKIRCPVCRNWHVIDEKMGTVIPKPETAQALMDLKQGQAEIIRGMNNGFSQVSTDLRRLISQADEQFAALLNTLTDTAKDGPRLFSFEAVEPGFFDKPDWISRKFRLTLWCEHARLPLPIISSEAERGVYELSLSREWLTKAAPLLKVLSTTLSLALPAAGSAAKLLIDSADYKLVEDQLKFGQDSAQSVLKAGDEMGDWLTSNDQTELGNTGQKIIRAQGSMLRELHVLLKEKDPASKFGGLVRVQNKKQEFLWVHENFVDEY